jgi:hypothetical protein
MKNNKLFPYLVALSAVSISFSAAFYSIFGIGKMFAGASTNVMVMAASLEFAKLVIASFLYRFWDDVNKVLRVYLTIACFVLIVITSAGIYGFLSSAYQETANKVENVDKNTAVIVKKKEMIQRQLDQAEKQLELKSTRQNTLSDMRNRQQTNADNLISQNKSVSSVRSQMNQLSKESSALDQDIKVLQDTIASKTQQIGDLDTEILNLSTNKDLAAEVGPLKYIAKLTGKTLDQVVNWFIIALMLVFDPLAIALVIAANFIFSKVQEESQKKEEKDDKKEDEKKENPQGEENENSSVVAKIKNIFKKQQPEGLDIVFKIPDPIEEEVIEEIKDEEVKQEVAKDFIIGVTPVPDVKEEENMPEGEVINSPEIFSDLDESITEEEITNDDLKSEEETEEFSVEQEISEEDFEEDPEEESEEDSEQNTEDGEFGGYKLGNVYKKKPKSLKEADPKNVPPELLITKGDPTRL